MNTALAFSGGKDSLACLFMYEKSLDEIYVLWVNTGKNFPETLEIVNLAKSMCKNFIEIKVDKEAQNEKYGIPSDLVPINNTYLGQAFTGNNGLRVQSYLDCCQTNISNPINNAVRELGITYLISGQRNEEGHKHPLRNGDVLNGVTHLHPIEEWTTQQVMDYLSTKMEVPEHLYLSHSSLDCYDCTAYLKETKDLGVWASVNHPELYAQKVIKLDKLYSEIRTYY